MNENFTGRELREFITDNKIKIAMSEKQSNMIVEQIHQEGFSLCIKDNNLYITEICKIRNEEQLQKIEINLISCLFKLLYI